MRKDLQKRIEKALIRQKTRESKKRNTAAFFEEFICFHRPWLQEIADRYRKRRVFPPFPEYILPSFYEDNKDKEIAAFAGMFVRKETQGILEMKDVLGEHPAEWFRSRGFIELTMGNRQRETTGGMLNWKVSTMFSELYDLTMGGKTDLETSLRAEAAIRRTTLEKCIVELCAQGGCPLHENRPRLALIVLSPCDGFGSSVWTRYPYELRTPVTMDVARFMRLWWPDYTIVGNVDECIPRYGLRESLDFFYAYLGYCEMERIMPEQVKHYAKRYYLWYKSGARERPSRWRVVMPEIPF